METSGVCRPQTEGLTHTRAFLQALNSGERAGVRRDRDKPRTWPEPWRSVPFSGTPGRPLSLKRHPVTCFLEVPLVKAKRTEARWSEDEPRGRWKRERQQLGRRRRRRKGERQKRVDARLEGEKKEKDRLGVARALPGGPGVVVKSLLANRQIVCSFPSLLPSSGLVSVCILFDWGEGDSPNGLQGKRSVSHPHNPPPTG